MSKSGYVKIGRNDTCWCGSGNKYKKCHLSDDKKPKLYESFSQEIAKHNELIKKAFSKKYCSVPDSFKDDCDGKICKAHSVSKSGCLKRIAVNSHVYGYKPDMFSLHNNEGNLSPEKISINKASTFTGFCEKHDGILFGEIEQIVFNRSKRQLFLHAYRAICREYFMSSPHLLNTYKCRFYFFV